jgi:S-adenosylmethionine hydrolase
VALAAPGGFLVGPDNGLLTPAARVLGGVHTAVELPVPDGTPATFHGRDVFAPAAAALAAGRALTQLGERIEPATLVKPREAVARVLHTAGASRRNGAGAALPGAGTRPGSGGAEPGEPASVEAEVVLVDRFGNVQLAASGTLLNSAGFATGRQVRLTFRGASRAVLFGRTFSSVPTGEPVLYVDAARMAAIAVNCGDAAAVLGLRPADLVRLTAD